MGNNKNWMERWIPIIGTIIFGLLLAIAMIESQIAKPDGERETKCYDKYGREIKGLTCIEKVWCSDWGIIYNKCKEKGK